MKVLSPKSFLPFGASFFSDGNKLCFDHINHLIQKKSARIFAMRN
jgi:hypothetical protein